LLDALLKRGETIRCLVRRPDEFGARVPASVEVVGGDIRDPDAAGVALQGVDTAYYLVHSMGLGPQYQEEDRRAAENFASAASSAGVRRLIYLGGLGRGRRLSEHLASRQEVGRIFKKSGVTTLEFRSSIIIGSGSVSFELIRSLVDRLPLMVTPRWTRILTQPIAIEDVLAYLVAALDVDVSESRVVEIGSPDAASYGDLMREYARKRRFRRVILPVPVLSTRLSSLWLGLVTPIYARVGRELIEGVRNDTTVKDDSALRLFPEVKPRGLSEAIDRALRLEDEEFARTRWCDAHSSSGPDLRSRTVDFGRRLIDHRAEEVPVAPEQAFAPIRCIGGEAGWYHADFLWTLRGLLDLMVGGVGCRRGRSHRERLRVGDTIDFWRIESVETNHLLRLVAEMRLPGRAWLQFEVDESPRGAIIRQTAIFDPAGVVGKLYWYALFPIHRYIFGGMLRGIAERARHPS
jgi:uncharacterized protein YbjT (DUF2867 family)